MTQALPMPNLNAQTLLENALCDQTNPTALIKVGSIFIPVSLDLIHIGNTSC